MSNALEKTSGDIGHIHFGSINITVMNSLPRSCSPYGDDWDIVWLGHCGQEINRNHSDAVRTNDETVPEVENVRMFLDMEGKRLKPYPDHTRIAT